MLKKAFWLSIAAGVMIGIGGTVFLACDNRYIGAVMFTVALLGICQMRLYLYTGKIGYICYEHRRDDVATVAVTLGGNLLGTLAAGLAVGFMKPGYIETALALCERKLTMAPMQVLVAGFFCGILMYTAVSVYKERDTHMGILFCVPVFIICGFEHSIADMFYFFAARLFTGSTALFLLLVVIGNSLGGMLIPAFKLLAGEKCHES